MAYHLTHPDSEQEIEREADQVASYVAQGWETKPGANPPPSTEVPADPAARNTSGKEAP